MVACLKLGLRPDLSAVRWDTGAIELDNFGMGDELARAFAARYAIDHRAINDLFPMFPFEITHTLTSYHVVQNLYRMSCFQFEGGCDCSLPTSMIPGTSNIRVNLP